MTDPAQMKSIVSIILSGRGAMSTKELAGHLGISTITILRRARAGRIPSFRVGGSIRFDRAAVARWLIGQGVVRMTSNR